VDRIRYEIQARIMARGRFIVSVVNEELKPYGIYLTRKILV